VISALDVAVGPIKQRDRGFGAGEVLVGLAAAQMAGEDFPVGLDRRRVDVAGQVIAPVPGLSSTTAAGLARRFTDPQWTAVETGVAWVTERMLERVPTARRTRLCDAATIDIDASDVEPRFDVIRWPGVSILGSDLCGHGWDRQEAFL
jgi:hypothetical protein